MMNIEALALLETPTARKLVATWPRVREYTDVMATVRRWSQVSGVHAKIARRWLEPLLENEIIMLDGQIAEEAAQYIATCALSRAKFASESPRQKQKQPYDA